MSTKGKAGSAGPARANGRKKLSSGKKRGWSAGELKWERLSAAAGHEPLASIHAYTGIPSREAEEFLRALEESHRCALAAQRRRADPR